MQRSASQAGHRNPKINFSRQKSIHLGVRIWEVTGSAILFYSANCQARHAIKISTN
jgi:hypothetical protein